MKYQGSKNRTASEIIPLMISQLKKGDYFVDLFCGGCNLIDKVPPDFIRLSNDNNEFLIENNFTFVETEDEDSDSTKE